MPITITPATGPARTIEPLPGTLHTGGGHDDRGGTSIPRVRVGIARYGTCKCLVRDSGDQALGALLALRSGLGEGDVTVAGDVPEAAEALLDISLHGDAVQLATLTWRGTLP